MFRKEKYSDSAVQGLDLEVTVRATVVVPAVEEEEVKEKVAVAPRVTFPAGNTKTDIPAHPGAEAGVDGHVVPRVLDHGQGVETMSVHQVLLRVEIVVKVKNHFLDKHISTQRLRTRKIMKGIWRVMMG